MNFKLRFALLFTSFVASILLIACTSIYFLYSTYREEDYYNRVQSEGDDLFEIYTNLKAKSSKVTEEQVFALHRIELINERLYILDSTGKLEMLIGKNSPMSLPHFNLKTLKKKGVLKFTNLNQYQIVVMYKAAQKKILISAAYDRVGFRKLNTMKLILAGVFGGSLLLTAVISFLFVRQAIKPIVELSNQMQRTNELNLSERIFVKPTKDEINAIAQNFNAML